MSDAPALFDNLPIAVSIDRQIAAVKREIKLRRMVYPERVARERMTQAKADEEIAVMQAVLATLENTKASGGGGDAFNRSRPAAAGETSPTAEGVRRAQS